jgi:hypothetical protein
MADSSEDGTHRADSSEDGTHRVRNLNETAVGFLSTNLIHGVVTT